NTIHHAYKGAETKEWRMFAQHKNGILTVSICDLGMGIPKSLRRKPELKELLSSPLQVAKKKRDTSLIDIAVESSRSKTKLPHRGKGLKDMLDLVKSGTLGGFRIFSARGVFNYNVLDKKESGRDYKSTINGTIIEWQISLEDNHDQ
ncbi:MAG: ATP-binding protein, partial [Methylococcaceae bacterium]|nr:ATP-binding protein [Methylococcaceae bacterium]